MIRMSDIRNCKIGFNPSFMRFKRQSLLDLKIIQFDDFDACGWI